MEANFGVLMKTHICGQTMIRAYKHPQLFQIFTLEALGREGVWATTISANSQLIWWIVRLMPVRLKLGKFNSS